MAAPSRDVLAEPRHTTINRADQHRVERDLIGYAVLDPPTDHYQEFEGRIIHVIWELAERLLQLGLDVMPDFGFWSRAARDEARARAQALGVPRKLYFVDCSEKVMRRRVLDRTTRMPAGEVFIDEAAFELFRSRFEPLGPDEEHVRFPTDTGHSLPDLRLTWLGEDVACQTD